MEFGLALDWPYIGTGLTGDWHMIGAGLEW